jgi:hypothetical protein
MSENFDKPTLKERMQTAALLPGHDPVRAQILQEIAAANSENPLPMDDHAEQTPAGREWLTLSEETERLKLALLSVPVPAGLESRLLAIPDESAKPAIWWNRPLPDLFTLRRLAVAASLLLLVAAGWWAYAGVQSWRERRAIEHVAALAVDLHKTVAVQTPADQITTSDPREAQAFLQPRLNFPAIMLSAPNTRLISAAVVRLGNAPAALTRWQREGHTYSLFEFIPASVGLPANFPQQATEDATPGPAGVPMKTVLWTEPLKGCGWALVMDKTAKNTFTY